MGVFRIKGKGKSKSYVRPVTVTDDTVVVEVLAEDMEGDYTAQETITMSVAEAAKLLEHDDSEDYDDLPAKADSQAYTSLKKKLGVPQSRKRTKDGEKDPKPPSMESEDQPRKAPIYGRRNPSLNNNNVLQTVPVPDRIAVATWNVHHLGEVHAPSRVVAELLQTLLTRGDALESQIAQDDFVNDDLPKNPAKRARTEGRFDRFTEWRDSMYQTHAALLEAYEQENGALEADDVEPGEVMELLKDWSKAYEKVQQQMEASETAAAVEKRTREKLAIAEHCALMFQWNDWLDALVLQEVRSGVTMLEEALKNDASLTMNKGPRMKSMGGQSGGQEEYYPILYRTTRIESVKYWGSVKTDGDINEDEGEDEDKRLVRWQKTDGTFRPTVVYEVKLKRRPNDTFRIGVVHTTPGKARTAETSQQQQSSDDEMQREDQYLQVKALYEKIDAKTPEFCTDDANPNATVHWIIGGDYYIAAEAQVSSPSIAIPKTGSYSNIGKHRLYDDDGIADIAEGELHKRGVDTSTVAVLIQKLEEQKLFGPIKKKRLKELAARAGKIEAGEVNVKNFTQADYDRTRRLLLVKLWTGLVDRDQQKSVQERQSRKINEIVSRSGVSVVRHELGLSFVKQLPGSLTLMQPVSGTNWHEVHGIKKGTPAYYAIARTADFFVVTRTFELLVISRTGLLYPKGKLLLADTEDLSCTEYWKRLSDHFPVACFLALEETAEPVIKNAIRVPEILQTQKGSRDEIEALRQDVLATMLLQLLNVIEEHKKAPGLSEAVQYINQYQLRSLITVGDDGKTAIFAITADPEYAGKLITELARILTDFTDDPLAILPSAEDAMSDEDPIPNTQEAWQIYEELVPILESMGDNAWISPDAFGARTASQMN